MTESGYAAPELYRVGPDEAADSDASLLNVMLLEPVRPGGQIYFPERPRVMRLMRLIHIVMDASTGPQPEEKQKDALQQLSRELHRTGLGMVDRRLFVKEALETDIVNTAADLVQSGCISVAVAACNFLGVLVFDSDDGTRAVLQVFDRVSSRFACTLKTLSWEYMSLLEAAIVLCVNIAATCRSGHPKLVPLVRHVCIQIIENPRASKSLRANTILLLANLSITVGQELRELGVAEALLELVMTVQDPFQLSVAETVIIILHGDHKCDVIDKLMDLNIVQAYCVPIMRSALQAEEFRGMCPHLMYSSILFQVLSKHREYAEMLAQNEHVVPLLLEAVLRRETRVETDVEGRRLALEALRALADFKLWRPESEDAFLMALPQLLGDDHAGIRAAAAGIWAPLHPNEVHSCHLLGARLNTTANLPSGLWQTKVMSFLLP